MPCIATPLKPRDPRRTSNRGHPLLHAWRAGMDEPIFGEIDVRPAYAALRSEPTDCSREENAHAKQMNETEANRLRTFLQTPGAPGPAAARQRDEICCSAAHTDRAPGSPALEAAPTRHRRTSGYRRQTSSGSLHCESAARVYCRQPAAQATPRH